MGTLPIIHLKRLRLLGPSTQLPVSSIIILLITLMIGMQGRSINCSGSVGLGRPYLFRDFLMPTGQAPPLTSTHAQIANLYHSHQLSHIKKGSSQSQHRPSSHSTGSYLEYFDEIIGSSEEDPGLQYTAPLILDIDDPDKGRWIGFEHFDDADDDIVDDAEEYEEGSISSTEFQSRSGSASVTTENQKSETSQQQQQKNAMPGSSSRSKESDDGDKRGILDYLGNPLMSFWQGGDDDSGQQPQNSDMEMPQSDDGDIPYFDYQQYAYLPYGSYDYESQSQLYQQYFESLAADPQNDQSKPNPMMMMMHPMVMNPKKPKPMTKAKSPKPKQKPKQKTKAKPKPKPKPKPPMPPGMPMHMMPMKMKKKKKPSYSQQFHYQEVTKPDKLTIVKEKLAKLNPFRYVPHIQIQKPQIKIEKIPAEGPPPMRMPPRRKPPMMMPMPIKMKKPPKQKLKKPKQPKQPKPPKQKQPKPPKKPQGDESNPEFVMILGDPYSYAADQAAGAQANPSGENSQEETEDGEVEEAVEEEDEEEEADEDDDDEDEEEDEEEYESYDTEDVPYGLTEDDSMTILQNDDDETEGTLSDDETILVEDDEAGPYEDSSSSGLFGSLGERNNGAKRTTSNGRDEQDSMTSAEQKEKSISIVKSFGLRRRKKHRRRPKPKPARRPPNWKKYRPAPLLPEFPEGLSDALLKVVKNVGFLPEYGKEEKYGGHGHNKIKGKFTKTRPITLHHGLLTEVLRR